MAFNADAQLNGPLDGQLQQILLTFVKIYDCKNIAHLPDEDTESNDAHFLSYFNDNDNVLLLPINNSVTVPGRHPYRLCLTSFSPQALKNATFLDREFKRPVKIYLDLHGNDLVPITYWYRHNGTDFNSPPLISINSVSERK